MENTDLNKIIKEAGLDPSNYVIRTKEEEAALQANIENQKKERYEAAIEVGEKRAVKDLSEKLGYNLEGKAKTVENFHNAAKEKWESELKAEIKKPLSEIEKELESTKKHNKELSNALITKNNEFDSFKSQVENEKNLTSFRTELAKGIPANVELMFNPERIITFAEKEVGFKVDNGVRYITKNGEVAKDPKTLQPITPDIFMSEYIKDFVKKPSGGAGEKDNVKSNNVGSYEAYEKTLIDQGINPASEKGQKMIIEAQKQGLIKY